MASINLYGTGEEQPTSRPQPTGNTGITGYGFQGGFETPPLHTSEPAAPPASTPQQTYRLQPLDPAKLASKRDPKYDFLRIAQGYNPMLGIQQGMIDELNRLGYANFYGSGQHIGYNNVTDLGRAFDLNPGGFEGDFIQNWGEGKNPNAQWAWDWYEPPTANESFPLPIPSFNPWMMQQMAYQPPQPQAQSPAMDPAFLQSLLGPLRQMFSPQPGYSAMSAPSFSGAQGGMRAAPQANANAQMMQMLTQLIAGLTGAR